MENMISSMKINALILFFKFFYSNIELGIFFLVEYIHKKNIKVNYFLIYVEFENYF